MAASDPNDLPAGVPEDRVDALYGLQLDDFTPSRDALAKELRESGDREEAAWVKGLRKPSAAAWVVNQLARTRAREAKRLLDAGERLRRAHERLIAGEGDAGELREAAREEGAAARDLLEDASGLLDRDGHPPSGSTLERAAETLHAAALDESARAELAAARVTRERRASGLGPFGAGPAAAPKPRGGRTGTRKAEGKAPRGGSAKAKAPRGGKAEGKAPRGGSAKKAREGSAKGKAPRAGRAKARKALEKATREQAARRRDVAEAERELERARREAERAQRRLEEATAELEEARSAESRADARAAEARSALDATG
ncbi:MAG TPA: hypothetical protein VF520_15340 [Thermoleophilaceae bacterium]